MSNHIIKPVLLFICMIALIPSILQPGKTETVEDQFRKEIEYKLNSMTNYETKVKHFVNHKLFPKKWNRIRSRLNELKAKIGVEISGENISTAREQFDFIVKELEELRSLTIDKVRADALSQMLPDLSYINHVVFLYQGMGFNVARYSRSHNPLDGESEKIAENDCPADIAKYIKADSALYNSSTHQRGSLKRIKFVAEALRLYYEIIASPCLNESSSIKASSRQAIDQKKMEIQELIGRLKTKNVTDEEKGELRFSIPREILALFSELDPEWVHSLGIDISLFPESGEIRARSQKKLPLPAQDLKTPPEDRKTETVKPLKEEDIPEIKSRRMETPGDFYAMALDVWQSAWGDFSELDTLIAYLNRNNIRKINLNPGLPMGPKFYQEGYRKFKPLVDKFRKGGIQKIGFLYAELNYPIEFFAKFLYTHREEFEIDTIVDDSEFVDLFKHRFEQNLRKVKRYGLNYSAFVTLESHGNSGVSDTTRYWVIDHIDYPILMSYFGCSLEEQKSKLEKYLQYADRRGIKRRVGVAILLGSKKVGREESCERLLNEAQMRRFLYDLHAWAIKNHPSYGGIVLETNLRMPKYDISRTP
jgi:hypothetical protein